MKKYLKLIKEFKYYLLALSLIIIICFLFFFYQSSSPNNSTGGSGIAEEDYLIIKGWQSKNQFDVAIGETITLKQQQYIKQTIQKNTTNTKIATIQQPIIGEYNKTNNIDTNTFYIKTKNKKFKIIINYTNQSVKIYLNNTLLK